MRIMVGKLTTVLAVASFCLNAGEGCWSTNSEACKKISKLQVTDPFDFTTTPILTDTPRAMLGRAEEAMVYLSKINMKGRNVVTVLGNPHVFVSSLEPCYSDWCGSNMLGFIDAIVTTYDASFIKNFLRKSVEITEKMTKFDMSYLKTMLKINKKSILVQCLTKVS